MLLFRRCITRRVVGLCMAIMLCAVMHAQKQYVLEYLGFADGIPSLNVDGITQDSNGLIWIASFNTGLIRYDGTSFKVFNESPESNPKIGSDLVKDVILDAKGRLWLAHFKGVDVIDPISLKILKRIPLMGARTVEGQGKSLYRQPNGDIWVATFNNGIFRFSGDNPNALLQIDTIPGLLYVNQTIDGKIFINSFNTGLYMLENSRFVPVFPIRGFNRDGSSQIKPIENPDGVLVGFRFIQSDIQVDEYQYDPKTSQFIPGLPEDGISVSTDAEMAKKMVEIGSRLDKGLLYKHAFSTFKDNQGLIWVAPEYGGIFKLKSREIVFTTCPDLNGLSLRGMFERPNGSIYVTTYNGVFQYFPKENRAKRSSTDTKDIFFQIAHQRGDTLVVLSESFGVANYVLRTPIRYHPFKLAHITDDYSFFASMPLEDGSILLGNQKLFKLWPQTMQATPFCSLPAQPTLRSFCFKPAHDGRIWVGTTEGVFVVSRDGRVEAPLFRRDHRMGTESRVNDIFEEASGRIWFATHKYGLLCYDPVTQQTKSYDQTTGFTSNETYKIASSHAGQYIWVSTFSGLQCIDLHRNKIYYFNKSDGTSGNEFNTGSFLQASNGEFYFGGVSGLTRFNPADFNPAQTPPPKPFVTELFIEDVFSSVIHILNLPNCDTLIHLSNSQNTLEFHFGCNDYFRPKTNIYYVQLQNIDNDWVSLGALRSIKYYRLPAGNYTLKVKFSNNGDKDSNQVFTINFNIDEVYYKKWWFLVLVFLSLLGFVLGIVALRRRRLLHEIHLRKTIAHNLHNTLGGKISGIAHMLHVIDRLNKNGQPFQSELKQMLDLTRNAHSAMSDVIWVLSRTKNFQIGLVNRMEDYADKWLKMAHIKVVFQHNLSDQGKAIPFNIQHELLLVYKEILGNILKHTFSEEVYIWFMVNPDKSTLLRVRNHFTQRKEDVPYGGQGLSIMKEHIERIGGKLKITSLEHSFEVQITFEKPFKAW